MQADYEPLAHFLLHEYLFMWIRLLQVNNTGILDIHNHSKDKDRNFHSRNHNAGILRCQLIHLILPRETVQRSHSYNILQIPGAQTETHAACYQFFPRYTVAERRILHCPCTFPYILIKSD